MNKTKKTKVLFITNGLAVGGAEKLLVDIVNRIDLNKIQPTIVSINTSNALAANIIPNRVEVYTYPRRWRYDLSPALKIRKLIAEKNIDVIVPFAMYDFFFSRIATLGWKNYPQTNIYIHMTVPPTRKWFLQDWFYTRLLRDADRFISVCNAQAAYWSQTYGISPDKFITVYGGVDVKHFAYGSDQSQRRDIRKEYGISNDDFVILQVANFHPYKHHEDALMAFKLLSERSSQTSYILLVGSGTAERLSTLTHMARQLEISDRVLFCGTQEDVRPFIEAANIFTLTSVTETFSIAALEAMAMGVPCVITDIGGASEMIFEGKNGFLVEPQNPVAIADGWHKVLTENHLFDKAQIRELVVDRFSIRDLMIRMESVLQSS
jgi:glycosyltransferase involved in cell wall biosynthesis